MRARSFRGRRARDTLPGAARGSSLSLARNPSPDFLSSSLVSDVGLSTLMIIGRARIGGAMNHQGGAVVPRAGTVNVQACAGGLQCAGVCACARASASGRVGRKLSGSAIGQATR